MIDRNTRIVDGLVDDAEWISLWRPAVVVDRLCPVALPAGIDLIDRTDFSRFRFRQQLLVVEAPPRRRIAAERLAGVRGIGTGTRFHIDDADLKNVTWLGPADIHWSRADVHTKTFARAAAEQFAIYWPCAPAVDAFLFFGPSENAFRARIAFDHALGVVIRVVGQRLDGDVVARVDLKLRLQELAEIAPMHRIGRCR